MVPDVALVRCESYEDAEVSRALREALDAIGGLDWVTPGMKIAVKANLVISRKPEAAATTHPAVLCALTRELTARGATKGKMVLRLADMLGVARGDIYCIGDHKNDIPMLEVSAIPFAPANCVPEVREAGAQILCHCADGAIADVIDILDRRYK